MADARAEEAARKAEAKLKKQREQEIKDAERDAEEMAHLMANDPEVRRLPSSTIQISFRASTPRGLEHSGGQFFAVLEQIGYVPFNIFEADAVNARWDIETLK